MSLRKTVLVSCLMLLVTASFAQTSRNRLSQAIVDESRVGLRGNVHPMVKNATRLGSLEADAQMERVTLTFRLTDAQQQKLTALLEAQQNPSSPEYHKWLSATEYADQFGLSTADLAKVKTWLTAKGLTVVDVPPSRTYIAVNGTAAQIALAFQTSLGKFSLNGTTFFANTTNPTIPAALTGIVGDIRGLDSVKPKPRAVLTKRVVAAPHFTSSISGNHFLAPDDVATIYDMQSLYSNALNGSGQKIVVVGQTNMNVSDVTAFRSAAGLAANSPTLTLVPGKTDPGIVSGDIDEASLDVEWSGAIARNAHIIYVYSSNVFDSMQYAISNNLAPVISISYGNCETAFSSSNIATLSSLAQQANAQGQTIVGASGDSGAADCDSGTTATQGLAVDLPASMPYVTGIGGTTFDDSTGTFWNSTNNSLNGSAISYIPEVAWNDTATTAGGVLSASGGGKSIKFAKPSWQKGTGVPADGQRDVPDISFSASVDHIGYLYCVQGSCVNGFRNTDQTLSVVGGTSAGAPLFSGVLAIINQKNSATQGNANPALYSLAASSPSIFHDITKGDNIVPCTTSTPNCTTGSLGFTTTTGYDQVTGWGTVDVGALVASWPVISGANPDFNLTSSATSLAVSRGSSGTTTLTVAAVNGFTGTVSLICTPSGSLTGTTCAISPTSLTNSGSATLTVSHPSTTSRNVPGGGLLFSMTGGVAALCFAAGKKSSRRRMKMLGLTVLLAVGVLTMVNCGGGSSSGGGNPNLQTLSGTVTVTATSGSISHTTQVSVTVQ